ncbi:hypothetical protein JTB14_018936 [Gonioctena quinquepunctata]|nr:hypothetical protein JTB14_018936 [Gonioctena quinquepunctata]
MGESEDIGEPYYDDGDSQLNNETTYVGEYFLDLESSTDHNENNWISDISDNIDPHQAGEDWDDTDHRPDEEVLASLGDSFSYGQNLTRIPITIKGTMFLGCRDQTSCSLGHTTLQMEIEGRGNEVQVTILENLNEALFLGMPFSVCHGSNSGCGQEMFIFCSRTATNGLLGSNQ